MQYEMYMLLIQAFLCIVAYSIQGQSVMMISPSSESHQQVVAVGQPLAVQPQGTVMVTNLSFFWVLINYQGNLLVPFFVFSKIYHYTHFFCLEGIFRSSLAI